MKTLLLTGATGFIGKHLLQYLQHSGLLSTYHIVLLSSQKVEGYTTVLHKNYTFTRQNFEEAGISNIDVVIHMGAYTPKDNQQANRVVDANSNIYSLQHLTEKLPGTPSKFIFISTLDVYNSNLTGPITELSDTRPISLYGWSKLYSEKYIENWCQQNNVVLQVLRLGHIYGSGEEHYKKLIPVTITKLHNNETPVIYTDGAELRSFLHVSDCVQAIAAAIELEEYVGPVNIVSKQALSVHHIVSTIVQKIKPQLAVQVLGNTAGARSITFDNSKMEQYLSAEQMSFDAGITEEIENFVYSNS